MTLRSLAEAWNRFFFSPQSPVPIALFRILYGGLVVLTLMLLHQDWLNWYGAHSWISLSTMHQVEPGTRLNWFAVLPQNDEWIKALFWVFLASAVLLTIGFFTRLNSVMVFLCLTSIQQRNLYITHGGDTFLRVAGFFLMFAPAGAAISIDRLIRIWRGKEGVAIAPVLPWAQRMIQLELSILYFTAFWWKAQGVPWVQGTALYYVYHLDEIRRFSMPSFLLDPMMLKLETWSTLLLEFSLGVLIWIKDLRYYILAIGVVFHLFLEFSFNIPLFEWDVLSGYILFVEAPDLTRVWNWVSGIVSVRVCRQLTVSYDAQSQASQRLANVLKVLDVFRCLSFNNVRILTREVDINSARARRNLIISAASGPLEGLDGVCALATSIPLLWPLAAPLTLRRMLRVRFAASPRSEKPVPRSIAPE